MNPVSFLLLLSALIPVLPFVQTASGQSLTTITSSYTATTYMVMTTYSTSTQQLYSGSFAIPEPPAGYCSLYDVSLNAKQDGDEFSVTITTSSAVYFDIWPSFIFDAIIGLTGTPGSVALPDYVPCDNLHAPIHAPNATLVRPSTPYSVTKKARVIGPIAAYPVRRFDNHFVFFAPHKAQVNLSVRLLTSVAGKVTQASTLIVTNSTVATISTSQLENPWVLSAIVGIVIIGAVAFTYLSRGKRSRQTTLPAFIPSKQTCINCGTELTSDSKFCNKCGASQG